MKTCLKLLWPCLGFVAMASFAPASAQQASGFDSQNGRYVMTPAPQGFLRMDTRSGAVSLCVLRDSSVSCASSADERGALEAEIARLSQENAGLRERLAQITQQGGAAGSPGRGGLPSEAEVDKALGLAETVMRRMMRIMREEAPRGDRL